MFKHIKQPHQREWGEKILTIVIVEMNGISKTKGKRPIHKRGTLVDAVVSQWSSSIG